MGLRAKLLLIIAALGALALALNLLQYRAGALAVEDALRADARADAAGLAVRLEAELAGAGDAGAAAAAARQLLGDYAGALERRAASREAGDAAAATRTGRQLIAVAADGRVVFHANAALAFQPVARAMPYFDHVGREMAVNRAGSQFYESPADGSRWLAAYEPVGGGALSIAAARNYTAAVSPLRLWLAVGLAASVLGAAVAALAVFVFVGRASGFVRAVARAAAGVAGGDLEQRIEARAVGGETRALAESFNLMTDRLREHIRRESEARQFQSFFRLSAMLTHDLKNAITGLAMLVSNMERQFHREEFRADAVSSLRDATDKLRSIVSRLSKPADTLSGEYRRALRPVELTALVRRVLEGTAADSFHEVVIDLPAALEAGVDPERIERVVENLIVNALEAMGAQRGLLSISAGRESEGWVFMSVADTGPGMTEEFVRTRLFRPFATTKRTGIGLGLYTCREVVEAHGGRLEVESEQGAGTRFRVVLPSAPITHSRAAAPDVPRLG